jgi:glycosyltransferase involved in cell wall biosynthesis
MCSDDCGGLIGAVLERSYVTEEKADVSFQVQLPNEWDVSLAKFNVGMTAGVETDICNPEWARVHLPKMDAVIVPSEHAKRAFVNTGCDPRNVHIVPEAYFDVINDEPSNDELPLNLETNFNFLVFGQITGGDPESDRKNLFYTIKWFCEAFKDDPTVGVVIKTNAGRNTKIDKRVTMNMLRRLLDEVRQGPGPKFYLLHGHMTEKEIATLYRHEDIRALVSLTRGEGFGLPILEAAACDLPVITTNWSAHTEFLGLGKSIAVDYELVNIPKHRVDNKIFIEGARWAMPNEADAKKKLLKFRKSPALPKTWAKELGKKIRQNYSQQAIAEKYTATWKKISEKLEK